MIALVDDLIVVAAVVLVTAGVGLAVKNINQLSRQSQRDRDRRRPIAPYCGDEEIHRGRVQAQGESTLTTRGKLIEKSVPWTQNTPPTKTQGIGYLKALKGMLTKKEFKAREELFRKAEKWITKASQKGGVSAYVQQNFQRKDHHNIRVDIEVIQGKAFIP